MGLTEQQRLYMVSDDYCLLLSIGENEVCGIVSDDIAQKIDKNELHKCGFYLKNIDFDLLYLQAKEILEDKDLI